MDLIIERLNGQVYNTSDLGMRIKYFNVSPPAVTTATNNVLGRDGVVDEGSQFRLRTIDMQADFWAVDKLDFPLKRNEIFKMFQSKEAFYITDSREPAKRWFVKTRGDYRLWPIKLTKGEVDIMFDTVNQPFAESMGTSLNPRRFDEETWQIGQGLLDEVQDTDYIHSTRNFCIYNSSDILIDPRVHDIKITFKGVSNGLSITNTTTGDVFVHNGQTGANDTIELDGIRMLKNGESIFRDTNHRLITLEPGYNDFVINGATEGEFEIIFEFRFYYF